jgi:transcriptional regulator with XRE-family HTH domain
MPKTSLTPVPTPAELGRMVKGLREYNKWSQATLAELAGVAERTIQRVVDNTFEMQLEAEAESFIHCAGTNQFSEGVRAFLEKRSLDFRD